VVTELRKLGVSITKYNDAIEIELASEMQSAEIGTYMIIEWRRVSR